MTMLIKYNTKNLKCFLCKDAKGQNHYQIFENGDDEVPAVIYADKHTIHLNSNKIPMAVSEYKYYEEICEIIKLLTDLEG